MNDTTLADIERAMIAIRRSQSRRALSRLAADPTDPAIFEVLDAIESLAGPGTVGEVGALLGVDQPRASRLVSRAVDEGLLVRQADQQDGRRALLALTDQARTRLVRAHEHRRQVFAEAMTGWPASDRAMFARLLTSFTASLTAHTSPNERGARTDRS